MKIERFVLVAVILCGACDPTVSIGQPNDGGALDGGSGDGGSGDGGVQVAGSCPRVVLGRATSVEYSANTSTLTNLVISNRLEWNEAPDDALEFTAAEAGNYVIELASANVNLGASAMHQVGMPAAFVPFTRADCPPEGRVVSIDGWYNHLGGAIPLAQDQSMVIFISAPYWAAEKTGAYTLKVKRVP